MSEEQISEVKVSPALAANIERLYELLGLEFGEENVELVIKAYGRMVVAYEKDKPAIKVNIYRGAHRVCP